MGGVILKSFSDRLCEAVRGVGSPAVVGLDPRIELMPRYLLDRVRHESEPVRSVIRAFHERVLEQAAGRVAAVKLQIAFYEQYGLPGLEGFQDTISMAKERGLLVIVDAKRNDIDSTAAAYAQAFLAGPRNAAGLPVGGFDVDCITVSPFLGRDSLEPFVEACAEHGRGIFVLVKTSNPGSADLQDLRPGDRSVSELVARMVAEVGAPLVGRTGYSPIGAVVGATFPDEARTLRGLMPHALILVPGYGAQGADARSAVAPFDAEGLGAVVNASRAITYPSEESSPASDEELQNRLSARIADMVNDIAAALASR